MFSYRTIAGVGAAALVFLALSRVSKCVRQRNCQSAGEYVNKATRRIEGMIRRRTENNTDTTADVV